MKVVLDEQALPVGWCGRARLRADVASDDDASEAAAEAARTDSSGVRRSRRPVG